nr:hypothetical protein [Methyloceanibacter superfactus]
MDHPQGLGQARHDQRRNGRAGSLRGGRREGDVSPEPLGSYDYTKRLHLFSWTRCNVDVFGLEVRCQGLDWPEKQSRKLRWVAPDKAAGMVREAQLADVLRIFASLKRA